MEMTKRQEWAIENIKDAVLRNDGHGDSYEYKRFEVSLMDWGAVQVITEVGRVGDEGTMAEVFCRTHRQIFIGKRGGLTLCNPAKYVKSDNGRLKKVSLGRWVKGRRAVSHLSL